MVSALPERPHKAITQQLVGLLRNEFSYFCVADGKQAYLIVFVLHSYSVFL